jgi:hypothetical protein
MDLFKVLANDTRGKARAAAILAARKDVWRQGQRRPG